MFFSRRFFKKSHLFNFGIFFLTILGLAERRCHGDSWSHGSWWIAAHQAKTLWLNSMVKKGW
jgi:hypothetical protein